MFRKIISTIVAVAFVLPATVQAAVLTAADSKCSDRYENTTRVNPTELSDYQRCIIDEVWSGENYGTIGTFVWLRVGDDVVAVTKSDIQRHGKSAIELAIVDTIVEQETALLEEAIAELDQVLTEIQNLEEALTELGFTPEEVEAAVTKKYEELIENLESDYAKELAAQDKELQETLANHLEEVESLNATITGLETKVASLESQLAELQNDYDNKSYTVTINGEKHTVSADQSFTIDVSHQVSVNINGYEMDTHAFTADGDFNLTVAVNSDGLITVDGLHTINGVEAAFGKVNLEDGVNQSHVDAVQDELDIVNADLKDVRDALTVEMGNLADAVDAIMNGDQDYKYYENAWDAVYEVFGQDVFYGDWIVNGGGETWGESLMNSLRKAENDSNLILVAGIVIKSLEADLTAIADARDAATDLITELNDANTLLEIQNALINHSVISGVYAVDANFGAHDNAASSQSANAVDYTPAADAVAETISIDESVQLVYGTQYILVENLDISGDEAVKLYVNGELVSTGASKGLVVDAYFGAGARFTQSLTIVFTGGGVGFAIANADNTNMYSYISETVGSENSHLAVVTAGVAAVDAVNGSISIGTDADDGDRGYSLTIGENTIANLDLDSLADIIEDAYNAGYDDGYNDGYADGYVDGYADGFEDGVNSVV